MLAKRIIPCLDVEKGRVVKGTKFLELVDAGDPVAVAARYETEGADELVFLDITASHEGRAIMLDMVRRVAETVFMPYRLYLLLFCLNHHQRALQLLFCHAPGEPDQQEVLVE